ncbi:MAG: hypothetical protein KUG72_03545 [Pseudomonadales bacterium]|nr:hypothetical protein [Pseudomonadales bacterium]
MQTQSAKQEALLAIQQLPDSVDFDDIVYRLYVINKIHQGMEDIENGNVISHDDLKHEIEQW